MKLLLFPLTCIMLVAVLTMVGLGGSAPADVSNPMAYYKGVDDLGNKLALYTSAGVAVCYYDGNSTTGSAGSVIMYEADGYYPQEVAWYNGTYYQLFYDTAGDQPVYWGDWTPLGSFARPTDRIDQGTWTWAGAIGAIALVGVLMFIGSFAGLRLFGSGESEESVSFMLKGTFFITLWLACSVIAYPVILGTGNIILFLIYMVLTVIYSIGIINQVGHPGDD